MVRRRRPYSVKMQLQVCEGNCKLVCSWWWQELAGANKSKEAFQQAKGQQSHNYPECVLAVNWRSSFNSRILDLCESIDDLPYLIPFTMACQRPEGHYFLVAHGKGKGVWSSLQVFAAFCFVFFVPGLFCPYWLFWCLSGCCCWAPFVIRLFCSSWTRSFFSWLNL